MKNFIAILLTVLSLTFAKTASAQQWFAVNAQVQVNQLNVAGVVYNNFGGRIMCRGFVTGFTYRGLSLYGYFNNVVIYPGQYAYAYAYTNAMDPFVNANSNVQCVWF
jgi:hypothetical protein